MPIPAINIFQMLLIVIAWAHAAGDRSKDATSSIFGISIRIPAAFDYSASTRSNRWLSVERVAAIAKSLILRSLNELSLLIEILISLWDLLQLSDEGQLDTVSLLLLEVLPKVDGFLMHSKDKSNDAFIFHLDDIKILNLVSSMNEYV